MINRLKFVVNASDSTLTRSKLYTTCQVTLGGEKNNLFGSLGKLSPGKRFVCGCTDIIGWMIFCNAGQRTLEFYQPHLINRTNGMVGYLWIGV